MVSSDSMVERTAEVLMAAGEAVVEDVAVTDGGEAGAAASSENIVGCAKLGADTGLAVALACRLGWRCGDTVRSDGALGIRCGAV